MRLETVLSGIMAVAAICLSGTAQGTFQAERSSPVYRVQEGSNEISLFERFSMFIEHSSRIKRVMDFDEEVLTVQPVRRPSSKKSAWT